MAQFPEQFLCVNSAAHLLGKASLPFIGTHELSMKWPVGV